jgi:hypothetical protein
LDDFPSSIVDVPGQHKAGAATVFVEPGVEGLWPWCDLKWSAFSCAASLVVPVAEFVCPNLDGAAVVGCDPEFDRVVLWDVDGACVVGHEHFGATVTDRVVFVDNVYEGSACESALLVRRRVFEWWCLGDVVAGDGESVCDRVGGLCSECDCDGDS